MAGERCANCNATTHATEDYDCPVIKPFAPTPLPAPLFVCLHCGLTKPMDDMRFFGRPGHDLCDACFRGRRVEGSAA